MPEPQSYFMGLDGFVWFVGVVEDRNDPDQLGRVRVRCLGFHTEDLGKLPTLESIKSPSLKSISVGIP